MMMQTQRTLAEKKKKATPSLPMLALLALLLMALLSAQYSSLAFAAQQGPVTATGVLVGPVEDGDQDPTLKYTLTDQATGTNYVLISGFVDLEPFAGQRVTITGVPIGGADNAPPALNVTQIEPAEEDEGGPTSPSEKATLYFEVEVEGEPPSEAEFLGLTATESLVTTPLSDPDGDGIYTGSQSVAKFAPGGAPEPITISPVQIVQGPPTEFTSNGPQYRVIKDFGQVKLDGDKTLSASVSFDEEPATKEVSATGRIGEIADYPGASHAIMDEASGVQYFLTSDSVDLQDYAVSGERVTSYGKLVAGYEEGLDGGPPLVEVSRVETTPPPDEETYGVQGTITSISDSVVLVEEDPSEEESGDKGYFTVTDETEITKQQEEHGESVPATFEEFEVGQQVEATYEGAVAESYPTQGNAGSILILEETTCMLPEGCDPGEETVMATFEFTVECQPPSGTEFSASIGQGPVATGALLDQDGDGVYTTSLPVERGTEQEVLIERLDPISGEPQAPLTASTIKDFGSVEFDEDEVFSASVSFCDDGSDNGGSGSSGGSSGGVVTSGLRNSLPSTGGSMTLTLLGVGALLIGGGLIIRGIFR